MKKIGIILFLLVHATISKLSALSYALWTKYELKLNNGVVKRTITLPDNKGDFITEEYKPVEGEFNYFDTASTDFQFEINNTIYSGKGKWLLKNIREYRDPKSGNGAAVTLLSMDKKIELTLQFLLYPRLPVIRKNLLIKNLSGETIQLE